MVELDALKNSKYAAEDLKNLIKSILKAIKEGKEGFSIDENI